MIDVVGIKPAFVDKDGPAWHEADVLALKAKNIEVGADDRTHVVSELYKKSAKVLDEQAAMFKKASDHFHLATEEVSQSAKKASGRVRSAAEDLTNGLARIEKQANFDRLDRYVALIERAAQAMTLLAELEKSGKLEKISSALK